MKRDLTQGSIFKSLLALATPIIFANVLQTAYSLTDTFWIGRLGANAVAAVSLSYPIIFLIISLGIGFTTAGAILVAQHKGNKDQESVNYISGQTLLISFLISLFLATIGFVLAPFLVTIMMAAPDVYSLAVTYMKYSFVGAVPSFTYMVFQSLMRGVGDADTPMYIVLGTVLLNFFLDPLFIYNYGFGVAGAAMATIATQSLAAIVGIYLMSNGKHVIHLSFKELKLNFDLIKKMTKLGLPASIEHSARAVGFALMTGLVAGFGTPALAGYGIGGNILNLVIIPGIGLSVATSALVGQNVGAGKIDRAEKVAKLSCWIGFIALSAIGIITFFFAKEIISIFIPGQTEVIEISTLFLKIISISYGAIGAIMSLNGTFRGSGNTVIPMTFAILSSWIFRFPLAYVLSKYTELETIGIWISFPITEIIALIAILVIFNQGGWKNKQIIAK